MTTDPKNKLNELTGKDWITLTKSIWYSKPGPRDKLKAQHPATYPESDIVKLISFFTKKGNVVLDPFLGSGSTLIACQMAGRNGIGIELIEKWVDIANKRVKKFTEQKSLERYTNQMEDVSQKIIHGDAYEELIKIPTESIDFVVTSPPYWSILNKPIDHKTKKERVDKGLDTRYSEDPKDLANITSYSDFLKALEKIWRECFRVLKKGKYICVVISDFRHKSKFILYHSDIAKSLKKIGFSLKGLTILVQDNKKLYPYGYPYSFVSNIHHQNIIICQKPSKKEIKLVDINGF